MTGVRIRALSDLGQRAISGIIGKDDGRTDWIRYFTEKIEEKDPYVIRIEHKSRLARAAVPSRRLREICMRQLSIFGAGKTDVEVEVL